MIVLSNLNVAACLKMADAIEVVETAMKAVSAGQANLPLRSLVNVGGDNRMGVMPGALLPGVAGQPACFGIKLLSLFPQNPDAGYSSHEGAYVLFEGEHGTAIAMMNAGLMTAIRTAAASAVATRALARPDARVLTIIGAGEQAEHHLEAMMCVRDISRVRVVGRRIRNRDAFIARARARYGEVAIEPADDVRTAVAGADIVCTVTSSPEPVLKGGWIDPGTHLNVAGASVPSSREVDEDMVARATLFVDYRASTFAQAGEVIAALESGRIARDHVRAEIGEVLAGAHGGRGADDEITLYRSLGVAAQDLAAAWYCMERARERGLGVTATL
ncbi:ornithine cyclodeaminase family protein [Nitratireductor sp. CAU 1489]|uniref:Ornithine cyclodeaminase family protein n=1 Tax=Nitratireductor arenosus TaxID=2682096 RepID=A0A844QIZ9_9HYPH|nr:ornithine cyclodeaminase family protein [Nitratireductor arenosus]MVA98028.1 ornithine cyclodeaminase family protein [Nitratireductor arenosus]